ncbi:hypothetical protein LINPERHAP2_LOCUS3103 [Linum perenne]
MMCTRSWIKDDMKRDKTTKMEQLEGIFTTLTMEDAAIEDLEENAMLNEDKTIYNFDE